MYVSIILEHNHSTSFTKVLCHLRIFGEVVFSAFSLSGQRVDNFGASNAASTPRNSEV